MPARYAYSAYIFQETTDGPLEDVLKDLLRYMWPSGEGFPNGLKLCLGRPFTKHQYGCREQVESDIRSDLLKAYDTGAQKSHHGLVEQTGSRRC